MWRLLLTNLVIGACGLTFLRQEPESGSAKSAVPQNSGSGSAPAPVLPPSAVDAAARSELHMKVPEFEGNEEFLAKCEQFFTTTLVVYDGKSSTIKAVMHGVCATAKLSEDSAVCEEIRDSFVKQMASPQLFGHDEEKLKRMGVVDPSQEWNEHDFDVKVFCQGVGNIMVAHKLSIGPKNPNGVINTPLNAEDVPNKEGSGSGSASSSVPQGSA